MDNGMWALGLISIPFICLIIALCLILNYGRNKKTLLKQRIVSLQLF